MDANIAGVVSKTLTSFNDPFEGQVQTLHNGVMNAELADEFCCQLDEMTSLGEKVPLIASEHQSPIGALIALYQAGHLGDVSYDDFKGILREYIGSTVSRP